MPPRAWGGHVVRHIPDLPMRPFRMTCVAMSRPAVPMVQTLASGLAGYCMYTCSYSDPLAPIAGFVQRIGKTMPTITPSNLDFIRSVSRSLAHKHTRPITPEHVASLGGPASLEYTRSLVVWWLERTSYTRRRRDELLKLYDTHREVIDSILSHLSNGTRMPRRLRKYFDCTSFIKREWYAEEKRPRTINSRSDLVKIIIGPYVKLMESEVYELEENGQPRPLGRYFFKHVLPDQALNYIATHVQREGCKYVMSDFSSFEGSITARFQGSCEKQLYSHLLSNAPSFVMKLISHLMGDRVTMKFPGVTVDATNCRMSGEMYTSLGNGFTNLVLMHCIMRKMGGQTELNDNVRGVVEGDDGLFAVKPEFDCDTARKLASEFGFDVKLKEVPNVFQASFCGKIFDLKSGALLADPFRALAVCGWVFDSTKLSEKRRRLLTAAKGYSMRCLNAGCPILAVVAETLIRVGNVDLTSLSDFIRESDCFNYWTREQALYSLGVDRTPITDSARLSFEALYGICPRMQLEVERVISEASGWFDLTRFGLGFSPKWMQWWQDSFTTIEPYARKAMVMSNEVDGTRMSTIYPALF